VSKNNETQSTFSLSRHDLIGKKNSFGLSILFLASRYEKMGGTQQNCKKINIRAISMIKRQSMNGALED
jgi:hypothetical protein